MRGDGDGRASGSASDAVFLLLHLFAGGPAPRCSTSCDADGAARLPGTVTDAVHLLRFSFQGGPPPPRPFPQCGYDTESPLGCEEY
ncbi:MAG: hypothetical protein ACREKK_11910, partial [Candidatus Methylomirabilales bacterium]